MAALAQGAAVFAGLGVAAFAALSADLMDDWVVVPTGVAQGQAVVGSAHHRPVASAPGAWLGACGGSALGAAAEPVTCTRQRHVPAAVGACRGHHIQRSSLLERSDEVQDLDRAVGALAGQQVGAVFQGPQQFALPGGHRRNRSNGLGNRLRGQVRAGLLDDPAQPFHRVGAVVWGGVSSTAGLPVAVPGQELVAATDSAGIRLLPASSLTGVADA
ncbi:hypothetical protein [Streptomyces sp. NBC_00455]|uniref:hypothetical protein n=1 Tax=Streptomyces sp. NBC_00455 TaxID=2903654 RepID=UPI002E24B635